ncbi:serine hydrolase domain-containing protein [Ekhidna sp.]
MKNSKKVTLISLSILVISIILFSLSFRKLERLYHVLTLFDEDKIAENFRSMDKHFPMKRMNPSFNPFYYGIGNQIELPETFTYQSKEFSTDSFLIGSKTTGLLILKNDEIVYEKYFLGNTPSTKNISWSMAKSFVATLVGIAHDDGHIENINDMADKYVPELVGTAYEGVTIKNILQMSSGVRFNEDYDDFFSDINRWGRAFALGSSQDEFATSLVRQRPQGIFNQYVSIDTHVLSMIVSRATGRSLTDYMNEKLWKPLGMEYDGYWTTDDSGTEVALCGLNATLRDFGKLGSLYLNNGRWRGRQIVSKEWIRMSVTATEKHLMPGKNNPRSAHELGYGYQWWIPEGSEGEFLAQGVYNQNIYVNPTKQLVIVKLSANNKFNDELHIPSRWQAALEFYRSIAAE